MSQDLSEIVLHHMICWCRQKISANTLLVARGIPRDHIARYTGRCITALRYPSLAEYAAVLAKGFFSAFYQCLLQEARTRKSASVSTAFSCSINHWYTEEAKLTNHVPFGLVLSSYPGCLTKKGQLKNEEKVLWINQVPRWKKPPPSSFSNRVEFQWRSLLRE